MGVDSPAGMEGRDGAQEGPGGRFDTLGGLGAGSVMESLPDAAWAVAADVAIAVLAVELALRDGLAPALGVGAILAFVLGTQLRSYRFRVAASGGQVRLAAGLLIAGGTLAAFGPHLTGSLLALFAVGAAKLARELVVFVRLRRRMAELGRRRRANPVALGIALAGLAAGSSLALPGLLAGSLGASVSAGAFLAGYSLLVAAMELFV